ncbi:hypothetical protein LguiA_031065 [Lonicera macranthoides]
MSHEPNSKQSGFGGENTADSDTSIANESESESEAQQMNCNEVMIRGLLVLKKSLEEERDEVVRMICMLGAEDRVEFSSEEQLLIVIEDLKKDLEDLKKIKVDLEMEVEFLKLQLSSINSSD